MRVSIAGGSLKSGGEGARDIGTFMMSRPTSGVALIGVYLLTVFTSNDIIW